MRAQAAVAFTVLFEVLACGGPTTPPEPNVASPAPLPRMVASATPIVDAGAPDAFAPLVAATASVQVTTLTIPNAKAPIFLDYIGREQDRVWVPFVSEKSGVVAVFDATKNEFASVTGFKTVEREGHGKTRVMGPSSVTFGNGVAYVGNRGTSEVCVVDEAKLKIGKCLKLSAAPDGVAYVAAVKEVWVTTPADHSLTVLDASKPDTLKLKTMVKVDGDPEGYAVDGAGTSFLTNLEDKNKTLKIDTKTHQVTATWNPNCGADGPRGLAVDPGGKFVVVACTDHLQVLDITHDGAALGQLDTGAGVDNIDLLSSLVYAAAGKTARFTIARIDDHGVLSLVATGSSADGARNAVGSSSGKGYVVDGKNAQLLVVQPATQP